MGNFYVGYGSNLQLQQIKMRCPDSKLIGTGFIKGYELLFKGVATIIPSKRSKVPVVIFELSDKDIYMLDKYEGVERNLYRKEIIPVTLDSGEIVECMVYILNGFKEEGKPSSNYFMTIMEGYIQNNLPLKYLIKAYERSFMSDQKRNIVTPVLNTLLR